MAFTKGHKLSTGRPVGSKNKRQDLFALCESKGINVFEEMLQIAITEEDHEKRFGMLRDLAPYMYAKKKEILNLNDHSPEELLDAAEEQLDAPAKEA